MRNKIHLLVENSNHLNNITFNPEEDDMGTKTVAQSTGKKLISSSNSSRGRILLNGL